MAGTLTFNSAEVQRLLEHAKAAPERRPTFDLLFDPKCHLGGKVKYKDGWPDQENLDQTKLPVGLVIVKDQGCYLLSNGVPGLRRHPEDEASQDQVVAYARESDPRPESNCDDWWEAGQDIMGGDDCAYTLEAKFFEPVLNLGTPTFEIRVTKTAFQIRLPKKPPKKS